MASLEKLQNKIEDLRETNAELKDEVRGLRTELSSAKKALAKAVALATKMGDACATLAEVADLEGGGGKPKRSRKPKGEKGGKKRDRRSKNVEFDASGEDAEEKSKKVKVKKGKKHDGALKKGKKVKKGKAVKVVDLDDSYED